MKNRVRHRDGVRGGYGCSEEAPGLACAAGRARVPGRVRVAGGGASLRLPGVAAVVAMACVCRGIAQPQLLVPSFSDPAIFDSGDSTSSNYPFGIAAGDINGDGYPDLVVVNGAANLNLDGFRHPLDHCSITVFSNTQDWSRDPPTGGLEVFQTIENFTDGVPGEVALVDLNHDGDLDVVVTVADEFNNPDGGLESEVGVYVFYRNGALFNETPDISLTDRPLRGLAIADLNNDTYPDVLAAVDCFWNFGSMDRVYPFRNVVGELVPEEEVDLSAQPLEIQPPGDVIAANFNRLTIGPAHIDFVTPGIAPDSVVSATNTGNFAFTPVTRHGCTEEWAPPWNLQTLTTARFMQGSLNDDVAGVQILDAQLVIVLHGDGRGAFTHDCSEPSDDVYDVHPTFYTTDCDPARISVTQGIHAGHLNGGTLPDLAVTVGRCDLVAILLGRGDGTFQFDASDPAYYLPVDDGTGRATMPCQVLIADLDQDGFGDVVSVNHGQDLHEGTISVFINQMQVLP